MAILYHKPVNIYNTKHIPHITYEIPIRCIKKYRFTCRAYISYFDVNVFGVTILGPYLYTNIHPLLVDIHCYTCTGNYLVYLYIYDRTYLSGRCTRQCLKTKRMLNRIFHCFKDIYLSFKLPVLDKQNFGKLSVIVHVRSYIVCTYPN